MSYINDGDRVVITATNAGMDTHPQWYHNLVANPIVTVEVLGQKFAAKAKVVDDDEEYERLYAQHAAKMPGFNDYRKNTSRRIPVIKLERIDSAE